MYKTYQEWSYEKYFNTQPKNLWINLVGWTLTRRMNTQEKRSNGKERNRDTGPREKRRACLILSQTPCYPGNQRFSHLQMSIRRRGMRLNVPIQSEAGIEVPRKGLLIGSAHSKDLTCAPRGSLAFCLFTFARLRVRKSLGARLMPCFLSFSWNFTYIFRLNKSDSRVTRVKSDKVLCKQP